MIQRPQIKRSLAFLSILIQRFSICLENPVPYCTVYIKSFLLLVCCMLLVNGLRWEYLSVRLFDKLGLLSILLLLVLSGTELQSSPVFIFFNTCLIYFCSYRVMIKILFSLRTFPVTYTRLFVYVIFLIININICNVQNM